MNPKTVTYLNQLNQRFYKTVGASFDATRTAPWAGWDQLLPTLQNLPQSARVLDVGCGNGRFGLFLDAGEFSINYVGIDTNAYLLKRAHANLPKASHIQADILYPLPLAPTPSYHLIVLFGVMHHIPGFDNRRSLIQRLMQYLAPKGYLILTWWAFYENPRFRDRIVAWDQVDDSLELEPDDYLLDWRRGDSALRYCHYVSPQESQQLLAGFSVIGTFDADTNNRYVILQH